MQARAILEKTQLIKNAKGRPVKAVLPFGAYRELVQLKISHEIYERPETQKAIRNAKRDIASRRTHRFKNLQRLFGGSTSSHRIHRHFPSKLSRPSGANPKKGSKADPVSFPRPQSSVASHSQAKRRVGVLRRRALSLLLPSGRRRVYPADSRHPQTCRPLQKALKGVRLAETQQV